MTWYSVKWDADVEAASPEEAAAQAIGMWKTPRHRPVAVTALTEDGDEQGPEYIISGGHVEAIHP